MARVRESMKIGDISPTDAALYDEDLQTEKSIVIGRRTGTEENNMLVFMGGKVPAGSTADGLNNAGLSMQRINLTPSRSALRVNLGGTFNNNDPSHCSRLEIGHQSGDNTFTEGLALYANGHIQAKKIKVNQFFLADYVFKDDYDLRSLKEIETYIKANGHLPEVPSQAEVAKDGLDVGEMSNILLKKIEEMTLHLIRMEKEIEALKKTK